MTPIDDLDVGDFIAVVCNLNDASAEEWRDGFSGIPLQIVAISLPFIACRSPSETTIIDCRAPYGTTIIDIRAWGVQLVSEEYFEAVHRFGVSAGEQPEACHVDQENVCQRCGERLVQSLVLKPEGSQWHTVCRQCKWDGGPVEAAK